MPALAQTTTAPPATERLNGDVAYFEETTYNVWNIRLFNESGNTGQGSTSPILRQESVICHEFDGNGRETQVIRYVQRNANIGSWGMDENGMIDYQVNEISRDIPDTRSVMSYRSGRMVLNKEWSYNLSDSTICGVDSLIYDTDGNLTAVISERDGQKEEGVCDKSDRNGSYRITYSDGTERSYKYDSDHLLIRYTDRDGMTVRYTYNERGHLTRQTSEWTDGNVLNIVYDNYEYDENGNWTRRTRTIKDPGQPPRSTKKVERTYRYRQDSSSTATGSSDVSSNAD